MLPFFLTAVERQFQVGGITAEVLYFSLDLTRIRLNSLLLIQLSFPLPLFFASMFVALMLIIRTPDITL